MDMLVALTERFPGKLMCRQFNEVLSVEPFVLLRIGNSRDN